MAVEVELSNFSDKVFAHPQVAGIPAFASGSPGKRTRTFKQVEADDYSGRYDVVASMGLMVKEGSTFRPGREAFTAAGSIASDTHIVIVTTDGVGFTLTLPAVADVGVGHKMWIYLQTDGGGNLTVDGNGAELIDGVANKVLDDAGDLLSIVSTATGWDLQ